MPVPDYMLGATPVKAAPKSPDYMSGAEPVQEAQPHVVAYGASGEAPVRAAKALDLARGSEVSPQFFADNLDDVMRSRQRTQFVSEMDGRPALATWAAQSSLHAAAVQEDAPRLGRLEDWFSVGGIRQRALEMLKAGGQGLVDIGGAEAMREYMGSGGPLAGSALGAEEATRNYDSRPRGYHEDVARAVPQMALYAAVGTLAGPAGLAGLLYLQNKGVLARQIQQAMPAADPSKYEELNQGHGGLSDDEINTYATAGSVASAVTLAGLLGPLVRSLPGAREGLQRVAGGVMARAVSTTVGQAAVRALTAYGKHTAMGALGMALQSSINDATVQKALGEDLDFSQLARETGEKFLKVLPVAATFAAWGPFRDFMSDRGRIMEAGGDAAKLADMVAQAKEVALRKQSPDLAAELFGLMGRGTKVFVDYLAANKIPQMPRELVAEAEAAQGRVAVPAGDYLARMTESHEAVKGDVTLSADGMTPNEAKTRDREMREALTPEAARALYGKMPMDELQKLDMPIAGDMSERLVSQLEPTRRGKWGDTEQAAPGTVAARPGNVAPTTAVTPPLHEVMAKEYGGTAEEWAKRLTPELLAALNEEPSTGAVAPEEHAARVIEATPIDDIDPMPFRRAANRAQKSITKMAEQAVTGGVAGAKAPSSRDVATLSAHELARDLNLAKAKRAEEVRAELDKSLAKMTKAAVNQKLRVLLNRAASPLLHLFDALTEGTSASPVRQGWVDAHNEAVSAGMEPFSKQASEFADARMSGALDEASQWFRDNARPVGFNEDALAKFLTKPRPWGELTPPEARNIYDAVDQLSKAAREMDVIRRGDAEATVREKADEIRGELAQNPDKGLPLASGVRRSWTQARLLDANAANALNLRPKNNLRQKSIAAAKWIFDRIYVDGVYARDDLLREGGEAHREAFESMPKDIAARRYETYDLSDKLPVKGLQPMTDVPRLWVWKLARHWGSRGNVDRIVSTSGWDRDVLSNILFDDPKTKLTEREWDYLQRIGDINEKVLWPKIKDHFEKFYGMAPPKIAGVPFRVKLEDGTWKDYAGGYEPLKRDARPGVAPQAEPTRGISQYWGKDFQLPWTPGSVKERVDNSHYLVNMDWDSGRGTVTQVLHWLAMDQPVRDVAKLLNDQPLAADMNQYMGQRRADMTRAWLKTVATGTANTVPEGMEFVSRAFGAQRRLALMGIVGGSGRLAVAQLSHPFGLMMGGEVNPLHGVPALLSIFKPLTLANGEVRLFPNWNDMLDYSKEVQHRADHAYGKLQKTFLDIGQQGNQGPLGKLRTVAQATAGLYLHAVDRLTTTWAAEAFHNEAVAKGAEPHSPEAMAYVNDRVNDVMPLHDVESAAPILTNQQVGGFLIMHGFKNALYQMRADAVNKSIMDFHQAEGVKATGVAVAKTAGRAALQLAMFGGFAIMGKLALGYGQQEGESKGDWMMRDAIAGQGADLPIIGNLMEPLAKMAVGGKVTSRDFTTYGNPGLAGVNKVYELLGKLVNEGREDYKKVFDALETALFQSGLPSRPVRTTAEHLYEMLTGENYNADGSTADMLGRNFYTEKQWESVKRSLSPDED
jgi:hypothetical protein